ncbi:MAG: hypothetical protein ACI4S9_05980 [Christensenellales bacterium]
MKKLLITLLAAICVLFPVNAVVFADDVSYVATVEQLQSAILSGNSTIKLTSDIGGSESNPIILNIDRSLYLDGGDFALRYAQINVTAARVTIRNLTVTKPYSFSGAVINVDGANFFTISDSCIDATFSNGAGESVADACLSLAGAQNCTVEKVTMRGSQGYGMSVRAKNSVASDVIATDIVTENNVGGGVSLSGGSVVILRGAENKFNEIQHDSEAVAQIRDESQTVDTNIGPGDELVIIAKYKKDDANMSVSKETTYVRKTVNLGGEEYIYLIAPYDSEAPSIVLSEIDDYIVLGTSADLSGATVKDNRFMGADIKVYFEISAADGTAQTLTGSSTDADYVNGCVFTPTAKGKYTLSVYLVDLYGNRSATRYLTLTVGGSDRIPPVIGSIKLNKVYTVGSSIVIPNVTISDANETTTEISLCTPEKIRSVHEFGDTVTLDKCGVYVLCITATDEDFNSTERRLEINVTNTTDVLKELPETAGTVNNLYFIVGGIVLAVSVAGGILIFAVWKPGNKAGR